MISLNTAIGTAKLCAWQPVPGITWIQTRLPAHARNLAPPRRTDSRLVARGVAGGFLRTFEFQNNLTWAKRLIDRYTQNEMDANEPIFDRAAPARREKSRPGTKPHPRTRARL
jgi:hypothetical protein